MIKKLSFFSLLFIFFASAPVFSDIGEAYHGSYFMKMKPGARANSMGISYFGFSDDSSAIFWNPAAGVTLNAGGINIGASYLNYDIMAADAVLNFKGTGNSLAFGAFGMKYPGIEKYDLSGNQTGEISNLQGYALTNFSFLVTDFSSLGFTFKGGYQKIEDHAFYAGTGSIGMMAQFLYFQFVLALNDLGTSYDNSAKKYQFLNPDFSFGLSYVKTNNDDERVLGASFALNRSVDMPNDATKVGIGGFVRIFSASSEQEDLFMKKKKQTDSLYLNLGFESYHSIGFRTGVTILIFGMKLDYAIVFPTDSDREFSHYASIELSF